MFHSHLAREHLFVETPMHNNGGKLKQFTSMILKRLVMATSKIFLMQVGPLLAANILTMGTQERTITYKNPFHLLDARISVQRAHHEIYI
jgi:hypothetical protein